MTFDDMPVPVTVPGFMQEIVAELSHVARRHPQVNQRSGVSVRLTHRANYENLAAGALRRALRTGEREAVARISDLPALMSSTAGRSSSRPGRTATTAPCSEKLMRTACNNVFRRHFQQCRSSATWCSGSTAAGSPSRSATSTPSPHYAQALTELGGVERARQRLGEPDTDAMRVAVLEFVLEGLHLGKRLNKTALDGSAVYGG